MASLGNFNARNITPSSEYELLPDGKYIGVITDSEMRPTKSGNGKYLELTFQVIEGPHKNRLLWARLNLENPSDAAVQIAQQELSAICHAVGVLEPKDSFELHNLPLKISVKRKARKDTGAETNVIAGYEATSVGSSKQPKPRHDEDEADAQPTENNWIDDAIEAGADNV